MTESSVTPYAAPFFMQFRPTTALDMVQFIPGFSFDAGADVRGLAGAAGNVMIDGQRPPGKASLSDALRRIPFAQVERIDLVRGGAPGIDMQGKSLIANVVRSKGGPTYSGALRTWGLAADQVDYQEGYAQLIGAREIGAGRIEGDINYDKWGGQALNTGDARRRVAPDGTVISDSATARTDSGLTAAGSLGAQSPLWDGNLSLNLRYSRFRTGSGETERFVVGAPRLGANYSLGHSDLLALRYGRKFGSVELEGQISRTSRVSDSASTSIRGGAPSSTLGHSETGETVARGVARFSHGSSLKIETGAEAAYNFLDGSSAILLNGVASPVPGSAARVEERRGEGFALAT